MAYTRKQIANLRTPLKAKPVLEELLEKVSAKVPISLAEEDFVCAKMRIMRTGSPPGVPVYDILSLSECDNYRFKITYVMYAHNLDGKGVVRDFNGPVNEARIKADVTYLKSVASAWEKDMSVKNKNDKALWNYTIDETQHQLHLLNNYLKSHAVTTDQVEYQKRSIFLHSKYIYLHVLEFFQDQNYSERLQPLYDQQVLVDPYCFVHTLFRHFAASVKDYQIGQSYVYDQSVLYKELPNFLARIIRIYGNNVPKQSFNSWTIDFRYRRKLYSIYLRPFPFKGTKPLRIQTFFPLEDKFHRKRVQWRRKVKINRKLTFLIKW